MRRPSSTLIDVLRERAQTRPAAVAFSFCDGAQTAARFTYEELDRRARAIAAAVQAVASAGDRAMLLLPSGLEYVAAFFGCLYAGAVAVTCGEPFARRQVSRWNGIAADAQPAVCLTLSRSLEPTPRRQAALPAAADVPWLAVDTISNDAASAWSEPPVSSDAVAFLQYTSGSTSAPRGVVVSHQNLLHNSSMLRAAFDYSEASVCVTWLPLFHDMGLIGGVIQPVYGGFPCTILSPKTFLQRPRRWLEIISHERATISGGPTFCYEECVRRIPPAERTMLDLTSWSTAFVGAEPIRISSLRRFADAFGPAGFRASAFRPCYGLAEATLIVSCGEADRGYAARCIDPATAAPSATGDTRPLPSDRPSSRTLAVPSCGPILGDQSVAIVDPHALTECAGDRIGEVWVAGPSVAHGYWRRSSETDGAFGARLMGSPHAYLRTGDLGFVHEGVLYVTGRLKDLIIIRGVNHYPQDIEETVASCDSRLSVHHCGAFAVAADDGERLVVLQEMEPCERAEANRLIAAIQRAVSDRHDLAIYDVCLVRPGAIPRTTSGKIRRLDCRALYTADALQPFASSRADRAATPQPRRDEIDEWLCHELGRICALAPESIDCLRPIHAYGLDSARAAELQARIENRFKVPIDIARLLWGPTIAALGDRLRTAALVENADAFRPNADAAVASAGPSSDDVLTDTERSFWFTDQLDPRRERRNLGGAMRLTGSLDRAALRRALDALVARHSALRTAYPEVDGRPLRRIAPNAYVDYREAAWSGDGVDLTLIRSEAELPFDVATGPLMRARLYTKSPDDAVFLLVVHHIVADFHSAVVLLRDVAALYSAEAAGRPAILPPLDRTFSDYAVQQARRLAGPPGDDAWRYWRTQLEGELPVLESPSDRPKETARRADAPTITLAATLAADIRRFARDQEATPFMVLLAVFQILLHRCTGQDDLLIGFPVSGRARPGWDDIVGCFVRTLPIRSQYYGAAPFSAFLADTRERVLGAYTHDDLSLPSLVERLGLPRDLHHSALVQATVVYQKTLRPIDALWSAMALGHARRAPFGDVVAQPLTVWSGAPQFLLSLVVHERDDELVVGLQYDPEWFDAIAAERWLASYRSLLDGLVQAPRSTLDTLPLLHSSARAEVLAYGRGAPALQTAHRTIHAAFAAQATRSPERVALVSEDHHLTFGCMNRVATDLAKRLRAEGIGPDRRVGIAAQRCAEAIIALVGTLKAGAAYVPIDPEGPPDRTERMRAESGAEIVLSRPAVVAAARSAPAAFPELEDPCGADNLAYVIYTSGSSGVPKGVMVSHGSAINFWAALKEIVFDPLGPAPVRMMLNAPLTFDASMQAIVALLDGHTVVIAPDVVRRRSDELLAFVATEGVEALDCTPSHLQSLLPWNGLTGLRSVKAVLVGGEPLPDRLWTALAAAHPSIRCYNVYGPTECTVDATLAAVWDRETPSIGRPLPNVRAYVLDRALALVPSGVTGELYLGGAGVGRGYVGQSGRTAERFVPDPFAEDGRRMYRTGDMVRWLPDGTLGFLGRRDRQVKVRGHRIELAEVEATLRACDAVSEVVVVCRERAGDRELVAYATGDHTPPDADGLRSLRAWARDRLPEYMVPARWMALSDLPKTRHGKVDLSALPAAPDQEVARDEAVRGARTATERMLAGIWAEILGRAVGAHDNFFDLGGHSLLATQVVAKVRDTFGVDVQVRRIFETPTVAELAEYVDQSFLEHEMAEGDREALLELYQTVSQLSDDAVRNTLASGADGRRSGSSAHGT